MHLFSEIYGAYFRTVGRILAKERISETEIQQIISEDAFRDSLLFLPQKLRPESSESWGFLQRNTDGTLSRITKSAPPQFLTLLQKRWLKAKLADPKMQLFLTEKTLLELTQSLAGVTPLYPVNALHFFDVFQDGDPYTNPHYRENFRKVLGAVHSGEILEIAYVSGKGKSLYGKFLLLKLEYSRKNDKFRAYCCRIGRSGAAGYGVINIGRILKVRETGQQFAKDGLLEKCFRKRRCTEPVQVAVHAERNGIERFLMEFAAYEKRTERDENSCTVWLWYDTQDETELLIRLLGFGPVVEILSPPDFRAQAAQRVARQYALLQAQDMSENNFSEK